MDGGRTVGGGATVEVEGGDDSAPAGPRDLRRLFPLQRHQSFPEQGHDGRLRAVEGRPRAARGSARIRAAADPWRPQPVDGVQAEAWRGDDWNVPGRRVAVDARVLERVGPAGATDGNDPVHEE